jgi:hypothetical protein
MCGIMAHGVVEIGKHTIESIIARQSAKEMKLKNGDKVEVVIKSTEAMRRSDLYKALRNKIIGPRTAPIFLIVLHGYEGLQRA